MKKGGHNFHPSRTSGIQKQLRVRDENERLKKRKRKQLKPLDLTKGNWSLN